ncbi:hypothetical protein BDW42DRAFT_121850 [Aspergillus taichungensis]|uniref:Uncharacterized protein n=1 Tax=Aspergillus taichungensis TaxID=482145 RepID=A0A2J5I886_9EURO|nr:hypothetical protein BDW42DRAFT_121850 [Aspergillus taichungensis]
MPCTMDTSQSTTTVTSVSTTPSKLPVLRIMSGKCNFLFTAGTLTVCCPCDGFTEMFEGGHSFGPV